MTKFRLNDVVEQRRIVDVFNDRESKRHLYAWHEADIRQMEWERSSHLARFLRKCYGPDLSELKALDVGCGCGKLIRLLIEFGVAPSHLAGVELFGKMIEKAALISAEGVFWHHGSLSSLNSDQADYDLVTAFTVFSSILDQDLREEFAHDIWSRLRPGGRILIFDFRYNNPLNKNVRRVTRAELKHWWPSGEERWSQTMLLLPPLARRIAPLSQLAVGLISAFCPFCRSHFFYSVRKPIQ